MKKCSKCGIKKPLSGFYKNKSKKNGVHSACIECFKQKNRRPFGREWNLIDRKMLMAQKLQRCSTCGCIKSISKFNKESRDAFGIRKRCKQCVKLEVISRTDQIQEYREKNKETAKRRTKKYRQKNKKAIFLKRRDERNTPSKSKTLFDQLLIIDNPKIDDTGYINVQCYFCHKIFRPRKIEVQGRISSIKGVLGGERNFYCSDECKRKCPTYGFNPYIQIDPHSKLYIPPTSSEYVRSKQTDKLKKAQCKEYGYNYCERCGDIIDVELHHTLPVAEYGEEAIDTNTHILLCAGCHVRLHGECA